MQAGTTTPFGFGGGNGCQTDADTGLVLMGHRYYDTRIGRFLSQDPIGDGNNWYTYAENNPVNNTDPLGLFDTTGMNFTQIYNEADREGGTGSVWNNTDANGYTSQFTGLNPIFHTSGASQLLLVPVNLHLNLSS